MAAGVPLTNEDRWLWLGAIAAWMGERVAAGESVSGNARHSNTPTGRCSLDGHLGVRLVFLDTGHDIDVPRLTARHGHFFPAGLLDSQVDDLEAPLPPRNSFVVPPMARRRSSWRRSPVA
jgi:gluconokinase